MTTGYEAMIEVYCRQLKLPGLRQAFAATAREARNTGQDYTAFLASCLAQEVESRRQSALQNRLHQARFPWVKTFDTFDFSAIPSLPKPRILALADGGFVKAKENVVLVGQTGTGKTHVAIALGICAIQAGYRVRFTTAVSLSQELLQAQAEARLPRALKVWDRYDLVILDELGYLGLGPGGPLLFQFCAHRYERRAVAITTNLEFSRWVEVFGDPNLTTALLDRVTHRAKILVFNGESYRFKESQRHLLQEGQGATANSTG
ncbi:MAG: IS21-like element helper ATPase IstB [Bacillota bacterium]|nr:IS21-like element helper ATPase IstB [Bacillota bacterium]